MSAHPKPAVADASIIALHQQYMDILNSVPDIVYWTDLKCHLTGCNVHFLNLIGLKNPKDLKGTPYELMERHAHWAAERVDALKLDDMNVIFSGNAAYNVEEQVIVDARNKKHYFKATRVPLYNESKHIVGLVVILTDISELRQIQSNIAPHKDSLIKAPEASRTEHRLPKVLMIEDNVIAQNVERALLTALNCQVDIADTGDKAMQLFNPGKYDLVLMDIGLEDTSGYVVAKQFRKKEQDTQYHVPIIALTGYEAEVVKYDCEQYCMEGAITKPLTSEQAEQIIKHYIYHLDIEVKGLKSV